MFPDSIIRRVPNTVSRILYFVRELVGNERRAKYVVLSFIIVFVLAFTIYNIEQHYTFKTYAYDLGIYMQALYTTAFKGMLLYETPDLYHVTTGSLLGVHFTPLTLALVPIYRAFPSALTLFLIQNMAIGLAMWFLYKLSITKTRSVSISLVMILSFMLNPFIHMALMFPFHIEIFCPLFIFMSLYYFETSQIKKSIISLVLLMLTIDFSIIVASAISLYIIVKASSRKVRRLFMLLFASSFIVLYLAIKTITLFGPEPLSFGGLFDILGTSWREILVNALTRPDLLVRSIQYNLILKMATLLLLLLPYISIMFYAPPSSWLIASPLLIMLLSTRYSMVVPGWHIHGCFFLPLIIVVALDGFQSYAKTRTSVITHPARKRVDVLCLTVISFLLISPLVFNDAYVSQITLGAAYISQPEYSSKVPFIHELLRYIDHDSSILVQNHIFPHLANRVDAYVWVPPGVNVEYALADINHSDYYTKHGDVPFNQQFEELLSQGYRICANGYGVILLARERCPVEKWVPLRMVYTYKNITAGSFEIIEYLGEKVLSYNGKSGSFVYGPYITLPPGTYSVTYELLLLDSECEGLVGVADAVFDYGTKTLVRKPIYCHEFKKGVFTSIQLNFSVSNVLRNVELRVVETRDRFANKLLLRSIELRMIAPHHTDIYDIYLYAANLITKGSRILNGLIVHEPGDDRSVLWFGPYIQLKRGTYMVMMNIKISMPEDVTDIPLQIDVVTGKGTKVLYLFNVTKDAVLNNQWTSISFIFEVPEDVTDLEIRGVNAAKEVTIYLAYIRLLRVG